MANFNSPNHKENKNARKPIWDRITKDRRKYNDEVFFSLKINVKKQKHINTS